MKNGQGLARPNITRELTRLAIEGIDVERCLAIRALTQEPLADSLPVLRTSRLDADEDVRFDAVSVMAKLADDSIAADLLDSLIEDPSVDVKAAAIEGLGKIGSRDAVDILCQLAVEPTANITWDGEEVAQGETDAWLELQRLAVTALGQIGDPKAIEAIVAASYDEFSQDLWPESLDALMGLGPAGTEVVIRHLSSDNERVRRLALERISKQPSLLSDAQIAKLVTDSSVDVRRIAVAAIKSPDADMISQLMSDEDAAVRELVLVTFCADDPKRISQALGDPAPLVQASALRCLSKLQAKPAAETSERLLRSLLETEEAEVACAVLDVAGVLAPNLASEFARGLAAKRAAPLGVRRTAIARLADAADAEGLKVLTMLVGDPVRSIRLSALDAIAAIANQAGRSHALAETAANTILAAYRGELIAPPAEATRSELTTSEAGPEQGVRRHGTDAAADDEAGRQNPIKIDREGNIVELSNETEAALADEDSADCSSQPSFPRSTLDAIQGINVGNHGESPEPFDNVELSEEDLSFLELAQGRLGRKTSTPDPKIPVHADARLLSCKLLAKVGRQDVVAALVDGLKSSNGDLRTSAAASLAEIGRGNSELVQDVADKLAAYLSDPIMLVRLHAVRCLAYAGKPALPHLERALRNNEPAIQAEAVVGLSESMPTSEKAKLLKSSAQVVRHAAADALAKSGGEQAKIAMREHAFDRDGEGALHAFALLRKLDTHASETALIEAMAHDSNPRHRQIALGVLASWAGFA